MTFKNLNRTATLAAALFLISGPARVGSAQTAGDDPTAQQIAAKTRAAYAALSSYSDSGKTDYQMSAQHFTQTFHTRLQRPNRYRIDWAQSTGLQGVVWSQGDGDYLQLTPGSPTSPGALAAISASGLGNDAGPHKMASMREALVKAAALSFSAAALIPAAFHGQPFGDIYAYPAIEGKYPVKREQDDTLGSVACYVISAEQDLTQAGKPGTVSVTLWIGKQDFLVQQSRTRYVETVDDQAGMSDQAVDEAVKKSLEIQHKPVTPEAIAAMRPQMRAIMKRVQSTLKAGFKAGLVTTVTHENIVANPKFSPADFAK